MIRKEVSLNIYYQQRNKMIIFNREYDCLIWKLKKKINCYIKIEVKDVIYKNEYTQSNRFILGYQ